MKCYVLKLIIFFTCPPLVCQSLNEFVIKGDEYNKKFDLKNAAINYEVAYKINPDYVLLKITKVFNDLGEDYNENKDEKNAENSFNIAIKYAKEFASKFPDSAKVYALLAMSYGNLGLYEGGKGKLKLAYMIKENAEKSINKDSTDYLPYIILSIYNSQIASLGWFERAFANTFFGKVPDGSLEQSERMMLKALKIQPGIIFAMFHLSVTYEEMGNEKKEIEWLKKIIEAPITDFRDKYVKRKAKDRLSELIN
jgi:tetratricopeptide (TPR) repeat protein